MHPKGMRGLDSEWMQRTSLYDFATLRKFVEVYEAKMLKNISAGLNSDSIDLHLNCLFDAFTYCTPLVMLTEQLKSQADLPQQEKKIFGNYNSRFREIEARLLPF